MLPSFKPMRKLTAILLAFCLYAADPWQSKPFTEWSDKDVNKLLTKSPWAREVSVELNGPAAALADGGGRDRVGDPVGSRPATLGPSTGPGVMAPSTGARGAPDGGGQIGGDVHSVMLTVRWQSALPVRQAIARRKYGAEAATSPDAKKLLDDNSVYLIAISGLPPTYTPQAKAAILSETSLSSKGKDLRPSDVLLPPSGKFADTIFVFQKTTPFTADDKDVEFSTKFGALNIKCKFRLKDLLFSGDLAL
jgi:hypothetical protein